jgi:hypothetical protein
MEYRTVLMEPYGALPRKCLFLYSFIYRFLTVSHANRDPSTLLKKVAKPLKAPTVEDEIRVLFRFNGIYARTTVPREVSQAGIEIMGYIDALIDVVPPQKEHTSHVGVARTENRELGVWMKCQMEISRMLSCVVGRRT